MKIAVILALALIVVGLSGCTDDIKLSSDPELKRFIGDWKNTQTFFYDGENHSFTKIITFTSDGKYFVDGSQSGTYKLSDGRLEILTVVDYSILYDYLFNGNDTSLTLTSVGSTTGDTYIKQ